MPQYQLRKLVVKPTLACTANCATCASRRDLHRELRRAQAQWLTFADWERVFAECATLGVETLDISGGEPFLYKQLVDMVRLGKSYGWKINLNSNGSLVTEARARELLDAGLDSVHISLYSADEAVHDELRGCKGLWAKACQAVRIFAGLHDEYPSFFAATQCLICRENFRQLDRTISLHHALGSHGMGLTYLEGDFEGKYLLSVDEIRELRREVAPRALAACRRLSRFVRGDAAATIRSLFSPDKLSIEQWAAGQYQPDAGPGCCSRPQFFTIILANGDMHPCNIVEYTHEPVMGNVREASVPEIWNGAKWNEFRQTLFDKCALCPINIYTNVPLRSVPRPDESSLHRALRWALPWRIRRWLRRLH